MYSYQNTGRDTWIYILDSGIRATHQEFVWVDDPPGTTRVTLGRQWFSTQRQYTHGTIVAALAAGRTMGVAKEAHLVDVRILDDSNHGATDVLINGIDWTIGDARQNGRVGRTVINASVWGYSSSQVDGLAGGRQRCRGRHPCCHIAGNKPQEACIVIPGGDTNAITVGASTPSDMRARFSGWGGCVTLFAPGDTITSAVNSSDAAYTGGHFGTSFAAPHVAGAVALYLQAHSGASPAAVKSSLRSTATTVSALADHPGSPDKLLYVAPWTETLTSVKLTDASSGKCLHVYGGASTPGTQLIIWTCTASRYWQDFTLPPRGSSGAVTVRTGSPATTMCLTPRAGGSYGVNGDVLEVQPCTTGRQDQQWMLDAGNRLTSVAFGRCATVYGAGTANGTGVILFDCGTSGVLTGGGNQRWDPHQP